MRFWLLTLAALLAAPALAQTPPPDSTGVERIASRRAIYSPEAIAKGIKGPVQAKLLFDEQGNVIDGELVSGDPLLWPAALDCARKYWQFKPYIHGGHAVQVRVPETIEFRPVNGKGMLADSEKLIIEKRADPEHPKTFESDIGDATVRVQINEDGVVDGVELIKSYEPAYADPAVEAARQFRFEPLVRDGKAVRTSAYLRIGFLAEMQVQLARSGSNASSPAAPKLVPFGVVVAEKDALAPVAPRPKPLRPITSPDDYEVIASDSSGPTRIKIKDGVQGPQVATRVAPAYPDEARRKRIQGTVVLQAVIGTDGVPRDITVVSGPQELVEEALRAFKQWRFKPFLLNGRAVEVLQQNKLNFVLG